MSKIIGLKSTLGEDRSVIVGCNINRDHFILDFTTPIPYDIPVETILTQQRSHTVVIESERVMSTRIKLSPEAFYELMRLGNAILDIPAQ